MCRGVLGECSVVVGGGGGGGGGVVGVFRAKGPVSRKARKLFGPNAIF